MIDIHLKSLTLHGFTTFDAEAFGAALSGELGRLVAAGAPLRRLPASGVWQVDAVQIAAPAAIDSAALGAHVAQAIYAQFQEQGQ